MESKMYDVKVTCLGGKKACDIGIKPGQEWICNGLTPEGMCSLVYNANFPIIWAMMTGATFPWQQDPDVTRVCCTNSEVCNTYELRRIPKK